jgi:arginine-tRNA-protein transferase
MDPELTFISSPSECHYLPDRVAQMRFALTRDRADYMTWLKAGWRRFGPVMFRHDCPSCQRCQSIRVPVATFQTSRSQNRAWKANQKGVQIRISRPAASPEKLDLFRRFHVHAHRAKGWPLDPAQDLSLFTRNPFPTEEWTYYLEAKLVGVGYVDALPEGLSAIYFFHDPVERRRSLGTFNILSMIAAARERGLPHVYLGYYVEGCRSLEYKGRFRPNEVLTAAGDWQRFLE